MREVKSGSATSNLLRAIALVCGLSLQGCGDAGSSGSECVSGPDRFETVGDRLFFRAAEGKDDWKRVWFYDGSGRAQLVDTLDQAGLVPESIRSVDGSAYVFGSIDNRDRALWRTDGNTATRIDTATLSEPDLRRLGVASMVDYQDTLYFLGNNETTSAVWRVGEDDSIEIAAALPPDPPTFTQRGMRPHIDRLMFVTATSPHATPRAARLWEWHPVTGYTLVIEYAGSGPLYFTGSIGSGFYYRVAGMGLWIYDGVNPPRRVIENVSSARVVGGDIYYMPQTSDLWRYTPGVGEELVLATAGAPYALQLLTQFDDTLVIRNDGEIGFVRSGEAPDFVARFPNNAGPRFPIAQGFQGAVYWGDRGRTTERLRVLFEDGRTAQPPAEAPGFGCSDIETPD